MNSKRSSCPGMFLGKGVPKICSKFTEEHPCRSVILVKLSKSLFGMGVLLYICCVLSEHLFLRTSLEGCSWYQVNKMDIIELLTYVKLSFICRFFAFRWERKTLIMKVVKNLVIKEKNMTKTRNLSKFF